MSLAFPFNIIAYGCCYLGDARSQDTSAERNGVDSSYHGIVQTYHQIGLAILNEI